MANYDFQELLARLNHLEDTDPGAAIREARRIVADGPQAPNLKVIQAAALVNAGVLIQARDAVEEGLALYRELHSTFPTPDVKFNLATAIISAAAFTSEEGDRLDHLESTKALRAEARGYFWHVAQNTEAADAIRTQSWTNLANQLEGSFRFSEAHDARLAALKLDPGNGVAAASAIRYLLSCYHQGLCSDLAIHEASALAQVARSNQDRIIEYAGLQAANSIEAMIKSLPDALPRDAHADPFVTWVEQERLTLAPSVELIVVVY